MKTEITFSVTSLQNRLGAAHLEQALRHVPGVLAVQVNLTSFLVTVAYDSHKTDTFGLVTAVQNAGYAVLTETMMLPVAGIHCASCGFHIESALTDVPGIIEAEVDLQTETTFVTLLAQSVPFDALAQAVQEAGYQVSQPQSYIQQES